MIMVDWGEKVNCINLSDMEYLYMKYSCFYTICAR